MTILAPDQMLRMIKFLNVAEKLKCELRHSWLSSGRQESVAEHTWRMRNALHIPQRRAPSPQDHCMRGGEIRRPVARACGRTGEAVQRQP